VPLNPVRGGLPMATDELAAFKLVGAALLMAYVEVRGQQLEMHFHYLLCRSWLMMPSELQLCRNSGSASCSYTSAAYRSRHICCVNGGDHAGKLLACRITTRASASAAAAAAAAVVAAAAGRCIMPLRRQRSCCSGSHPAQASATWHTGGGGWAGQLLVRRCHICTASCHDVVKRCLSKGFCGCVGVQKTSWIAYFIVCTHLPGMYSRG
jgi:hypothetical protein